MNKTEYKDEFRHFVLNGVRRYLTDRRMSVDMSVTGYPALGSEDSLVYFENHFARFRAMMDLCQRHSILPSRSCELGSFYPYTTLRLGGEIDLLDITPKIYPAVIEYDVDNVHLRGFNLCVDPMPDCVYDLVILSEVMEHLPCNLFDLCGRVSKIVRPGGHLIATYPVQYGTHAYGYDEDMGSTDREYGNHLREFTDDTVGLFFTDMIAVERTEVFYPAYGRIIIVLYEQPEEENVTVQDPS